MDSAGKVPEDSFGARKMGSGWGCVELTKGHRGISDVRACTYCDVGETSN